MYEPGVHTGMIKLVSFATLRFAGTCRRISTSNRCVQGLGIETVKLIADVLGPCACAIELAKSTEQTISSDNRKIILSCMAFVGCYYE
jgi:hypothetical protein